MDRRYISPGGKFFKRAALAGLAIAICLSAPAALAEKKHDNRGQKQQHQKHSRGEQAWSGDRDRVTIGIGFDDRAAIQSYLRRKHGAGCPPGLAKKNNGCTPPGLAKKYRIGEMLPDDVVLLPVPGDLLKYLHPAPKGYMYASVDKDILLVAEASKKVIDAVTLISAVGR